MKKEKNPPKSFRKCNKYAFQGQKLSLKNLPIHEIRSDTIDVVRSVSFRPPNSKTFITESAVLAILSGPFQRKLYL